MTGRRCAGSLGADETGSFLLEYLVLVVVVALPVSLAFVEVGRRLLHWALLERVVLTFPIP